MESQSGGVLVDSHLWIDYFSGKKNSETNEVQRLIRAGRVRTAGPVLFEVLVGPRQDFQRQYLQSRLRALVCLPTDENVWFKAVELGRLPAALKRKVPHSDVLIAAHAAAYSVSLFTRDSHFDVFSSLKRHTL